MGDILSLSATCLCEAARLLVVWIYCRVFYENGRKKPFTILAYGLAFVLSTGACVFLQNIAANLIATLAGIFIIALAYAGRIWKKLLCSFILLAVSCALDLFAAFLMMKNPSPDNYALVSSFLSVFLFFLSSLFAGRAFKKGKYSYIGWEWWYIFIVTVISLGLIIVLAYDRVVSQLTILVMSVLLFMVVFILYNLFVSISEKYALKSENLELKSQMDVFDHKMKNDIQKEKALRTLRHDMKHHVRELYHLIENNNDKEALSYLESMSEQLVVATGKVNTGVAAVDGILGFMISKAEAAGINVSTHIAIPESLSISTYDVNIIFGNILENAIEAAEKCKNGEIGISMRYAQGCLFVTVKNSYSGETLKENGRYLSTKKRDGNHGLGLKSVHTVTEKYSGSLEVTEEGGMFVVSILLVVTGV